MTAATKKEPLVFGVDTLKEVKKKIPVETRLDTAKDIVSQFERTSSLSGDDAHSLLTLCVDLLDMVAEVIDDNDELRTENEDLESKVEDLGWELEDLRKETRNTAAPTTERTEEEG